MVCTLLIGGTFDRAVPVRASGPNTNELGPRARAAASASATLLRTTLFTDGRGMHFHLPGIVPAFEFFQNPWLPVDVNGIVGRYIGANMEGRRAVGMYAGSDGNTVAMGCVLCHSGRAAGRLVVGLGNKSVDVGQMAALRSIFTRRSGGGNGGASGVIDNPRWTNTTRGMVPDAVIQSWFYRAANRELPADLPAAEVKAPHLWGYGEKRKAGLFSDGLGDGSTAGWAAMVELAEGQRPETVRKYKHRLEEVERTLEALTPPAYPFAIDSSRAVKGEAVFRENCAACHGEYRRDGEGLPVFQQPRFVAWESVGTDRTRTDCVTPEFRALVQNSPMSDLIRAQSLPPGYFAPRLEGVWARFPYLHNASVPTIHDLLTAPESRPRRWLLTDAGEVERFDPAALGLKVDAAPGREGRDVYSVAGRGHSNQGHRFGTDLAAERKRELIEYLKTL